jgi:hypothetical protein
LTRTYFAALLLAVVAISISCGDPGWPPENDPATIGEIFSAIRSGDPDRLPTIDGKAFVLTVHDGYGKQNSFGNVELRNAAEALTAKTEALDKQYLTLTVIKSFSRKFVGFFASRGWTYEKGLQGLAMSVVGDVRMMTPSYIATRDLEFSQARGRLQSQAGTLITGLPLSGGLYATTCETFTEPEPGETPIVLFRANELFDPITPEIIGRAIRDGGDQLVRLQMKSGRFAYTYNPGPDRRNERAYNLLRHCGTCYSLFQLYGETGDLKYLDAGKKGIGWLRRYIKTPSWDQERAYPVYKKKAKLGGAALALLAMTEYVKVDPSFQVDDTMHKLAAHLRKEQLDNGSFNSYYSWNKKPVKKRFSIYYPGEAMLALLRYQQLIPESVESIKTAALGADFLINERWMLLGIEVNVPPDAWLMMALYDLWQVRPEDRYARYCLRIADVMASDQHVKLVPDADYFGGYFPDPPQVTPAGSRMEGLTGAYLLAEKAGIENDWILDTIRRGTLYQVRMQVRPEFDHLFPNPQMALGTFRHSPVSSTNRIDYNQHNISGLITAKQILSTRP